MTSRLELTARARRDLQELEVRLQRQVVAKLMAAAADLTRFFRRLRGRPDWRLRVGDHRVLALLEMPRRRLIVTAIRHRRNAYG